MRRMRPVIAGAAVACAVAALDYGIRSPDSQVFAPSIYRGSRGSRRRRSVALTFDDGPSLGTAAILAQLEREGVRATFFQCGANVLRHPDLTQEVSAAGHEIGNHTFSHLRLCPRVGWQPNFVPAARIYEELAKTQDAIGAAAGVAPRWFRAPYGMRWFGLREAQRRPRLTGAYWTVIGHDWEWPAERVVQHVLSAASPGGVLCLHDGRDTRPSPDISVTLDAVTGIVAGLKEKGYVFETVSEIVRP